MNKIKGIYIKYKFNFKENINKSSYLYQKVFRSIYGYQQNVTKKNNKPYLYIRKGILTNIPHHKPGRNCMIVPFGYEGKIIDYFNTGINPTHKWRNKGEWEVNYSVNDVFLEVSEIAKIMENYLDNYKIINSNNKEINLVEEIESVINNNSIDKSYINNLIIIMKNIIEFEWFKETKDNSEKLSSFYGNYQNIKSMLS